MAGTERSVLISYLLWFLFPQLGLHRFYLGLWDTGLMYLGLGVAFWGLTLGLVDTSQTTEALRADPVMQVAMGFFIVGILWWLLDGIRMVWMVEAVNLRRLGENAPGPMGDGFATTPLDIRMGRGFSPVAAGTAGSPMEDGPPPGTLGPRDAPDTGTYTPPPRPDGALDARDRKNRDD